jgi:hypothetical protein
MLYISKLAEIFVDFDDFIKNLEQAPNYAEILATCLRHAR